MKPELFHAINDGGESARARQVLVDRALAKRIRIRNIAYPEVLADLKAHGGERTPALWDGERLLEGADPVIAFLHAM